MTGGIDFVSECDLIAPVASPSRLNGSHVQRRARGDDESIPQYGRVPYGIVDEGAIAALKPGAVRVYLVLCAHADDQFQARVGMRRLAKLTGMMIGSVQRSVAELQAAEVVAVDDPGNGRAFTYRIITDRSRISERSSVRASVNGTAVDRSRISERSSVRASVNGTEVDRSPAGAEPFAHGRKTVRAPVNKTVLTEEQSGGRLDAAAADVDEIDAAIEDGTITDDEIAAAMRSTPVALIREDAALRAEAARRLRRRGLTLAGGAAA